MDKTERMLMVTCDNDDFNFKKAMKYLFNVEGGYSNHIERKINLLRVLSNKLKKQKLSKFITKIIG